MINLAANHIGAEWPNCAYNSRYLHYGLTYGDPLPLLGSASDVLGWDDRWSFWTHLMPRVGFGLELLI